MITTWTGSYTEEMIHTLSAAFHAFRTMVIISNILSLKSVYQAYFHSVIKYGIIFLGNSSNSGTIFHTTKEKSENYGWSTIQKLI